jgi:hypothetical protein
MPAKVTKTTLENDLYDLIDDKLDGKLDRTKLAEVIHDCRGLIKESEDAFRDRYPNLQRPYMDQDLEPILIGLLLVEGSDKNFKEAQGLVEQYFTNGPPKFMGKPRIDWIVIGLAFDLDILKPEKAGEYRTFLMQEVGLKHDFARKVLNQVDEVRQPGYEVWSDTADAIRELMDERKAAPPQRPANGPRTGRKTSREPGQGSGK